MSIPDKVVIGPFTYRVELDRTHNALSNSYGQIRFEEQVIRLGDEMSEERRRAVLVHEVLHGILETIGNKDAEGEEDFCTRVSPLFVDTLRRNPDLMMYLIESDVE